MPQQGLPGRKLNLLSAKQVDQIHETSLRILNEVGVLVSDAHFRGILAQAGAAIDKAAQIAARVSGDSTVAYGLAFARAVEAALGAEPPPRAIWLRALMAELERIANHFGDIGAICNDAAFALMLAQCGLIRERLLRAASSCFGHRLIDNNPDCLTHQPSKPYYHLRSVLCFHFQKISVINNMPDNTVYIICFSGV